MPESLPPFDHNQRRAANSLDDAESDYERQTMAMSYMVTVAHFFPVGEPRFDVIDSRCGRDELARIQKELDLESKKPTSRLFVTEDLPRATYDLLERTVGVDPRLLDDHRKNGHGPGFVGRADLDIDKAPRSSTTSIAFPYDLQIAPEILLPVVRNQGNDAMESEVAGILKYHQLVNYLQYDWLSLSIKPPVPALFFNTYRRLSVQTVCSTVPTVTILLYPALWNLRKFQGSKYHFHISDDLRFARHITPSTEDGRSALNALNTSFFKLSYRAIRTRKLLRQLMDEVGFNGVSHDDVGRWVAGWIVMNAHAAFEASAEASIRSWDGVKSRIKDSPTRYTHIKRLCEQLRKLTEMKLHLMDRASTDLQIDSIGFSGPPKVSSEDDGQRAYVVQQWLRSRRSLQWLLNDIEQVIRSNESRLQIDLVNTQIEESRKAIQQAEVVKRLTALAFVFIPISTVCSAFGMNIQELSHNLPSAWVFATVALAVAISTVICSTELAVNLLWAFLSLLSSSAAAWRDWWQNMHDTAFAEQASLGMGVASVGGSLAGVKPWQDPEKKNPMKIRSMQRYLVRVMAKFALMPFRVVGAIIQRIQQFEQRGRVFKAGDLTPAG